MRINVKVYIKRSKDEPEMKVVTTPISLDKTLMLTHLVPKDDTCVEEVRDKYTGSYFMMVINSMLDTLDELGREFMFDMCEQLRDDYVKLRGEINES